MVHQIVPEHPTRVGEAVREAGRLGVEQDAGGRERRGAEEDQTAGVLARLFRRRVHDAHAGDPALGRVVDERMHHAVGDDGEPPRRPRGGERGGLAREIRPGGAAPLAGAAVVARQAVVQGLGEDRHAADGEPPVGKGALEPRLHELLARVHLHRRLELPVRELRQAQLLPAHADEAFHVAVPGRHVGVANRPVDAMPVPQIRLEIEVAPPVHLPPPDQRLSAHLVSLNPGERLVLDVGIAVVLDEEVLDRFVELARTGLDRILLRAAGSHRQPRVA